MMKKTKPVDWQAIYQQLLPEEERPEKVQIDQVLLFFCFDR